MMRKIKKQVDLLNKQKLDLVLSEKLFNLEISNFQQLHLLEEELKLLQPLYDYFMDLQKQIEEWGKTQWVKLEYNDLEVKRKVFILGLKKFKEENQIVLAQLKDYVNEFLKIFPIIEKLKSNSNFKETHWT